MKKALKPVRRRLRLLRAVRGLCVGLAVGCLLALAACIVAFFTPVAALPAYIAAAVAGCPAVFAAFSALWPIPAAAAAARADALGLKERVRTALAFAEKEEPVYRLQRADARACLAALPLAKAIPVRPAKRPLWCALGAALLCAVALLIPNPQHETLRALERERAALRAEADTLEQDAEAVAESLTREERTELRRITADMAREMREAANKREALEALAETQKEMDRLKAGVERRLALETAEAMAGQPSLAALAQALAGGVAAQTEAALSDLAAQMQDAETAEGLAEQLEAAANAAPAGAISQGLSMGAGQLLSGNPSGAAASLSAAVLSAGNAGGNLAALVQSARAVAASGGQSGSGGGQGGGQGSGVGGGAGGGGSGAGLGSTNQSAGASGGGASASGAAGSGPTTDRVGRYERIYDPTRLGDGGEISTVRGEKGEGESQQMQLSPGAGDFSGQVSYGEVIGDYSRAASAAARREALPEALMDVVARYFNALTE